MTQTSMWPLTCMNDGFEHLVADDAVDLMIHSGLCRAVCGHHLLPAPLVAIEGRRCSECVQRTTPEAHPVRRIEVARWLTARLHGIGLLP